LAESGAISRKALRANRRDTEHHRERFLSADELGRLGAVLRQAESEGLPWKINAEGKATAKHLPAERHRRTIYPRVVTAAVKLLLFTGCRLSEVLGMRWEHIDLTARTIVLPDTKAGRPQTVAINAPARQVLLTLHPDDTQANPWVLPKRVFGRPTSQPSKPAYRALSSLLSRPSEL
jgi:integrase